MTNAEDQSAFRERLEKRGGKQISVPLEPSAYEKLLEWRKKGMRTKEVINRLLIESNPED